MPVTINGDGSITGISAGGLPDGCVDTDTIANSAVTYVKTSGLGIIEVDSWNFSASFTQPSSYGQFITANWQRKPTHFTKKGTGMSESSGVFTFPRTGLYLIRVHLSINTISDNLAYCGPYIQISTNSGGAYDRVSEGYVAMDHGTRYGFGSSEAVVNVTNISTFRCRLETESSGSFNVRASNGQSVLDFIRLGDAT